MTINTVNTVFSSRPVSEISLVEITRKFVIDPLKDILATTHRLEIRASGTETKGETRKAINYIDSKLEIIQNVLSELKSEAPEHSNRSCSIKGCG